MVFFFTFLAPAFGLSRGRTRALFGGTGAGFSVSGGCCAGTFWNGWGLGSGAGAGTGTLAGGGAVGVVLAGGGAVGVALTGGGAVGVALTGAGGVPELAGTSAGGAAGVGLGMTAAGVRMHSQPRFFFCSVQSRGCDDWLIRVRDPCFRASTWSGRRWSHRRL